jgi:hypothetical protein
MQQGRVSLDADSNESDNVKRRRRRWWPWSSLVDTGSAETAGTLAGVRCVECGRPRDRDELWLLYFADTGEVAIYCPKCAEREYGGD